MEVRQEIEKTLQELFKLIGIEVGIKVDEEGDLYKVELQTEDSAGLLIGAHGLTLQAIQSFITIAVNNALKKKDDEWVRVTIDIAGWSKKQEERLNELAKQTADRARQTGEEQRLYNLTSSDRRIIHMALSEEKDIETISEGEGRDRFLVVRLRK